MIMGPGRMLEAVDAFRRHLLQTALSMLGVVLAVAVTLVTLAVNQGARREAARQADQLGVTTIVVRGPESPDGAGRAAARHPLTVRDAALLAQLVPVIAAVSPAAYSRMSVVGPVTTQMAQVVGVTAEFSAIRRVVAAKGRFLHRHDVDSGARVAVLGAGMARRLFGYRAPVGDTIRLGRDWYRVVGVLAGERAGALQQPPAVVPDFEQVILVPLPALSGRQTSFDPDQPVAALWVAVTSSDHVVQAGAAIRSALAGAHPIAADYQVVVARDLLEARDRTQRMFSLITAISAGLLFLLGGVAIANVMLAAVLERTPEIGLRRAVGATRRDVLRQFLTEASAISLCGGAVGVGAGILLSSATAQYSGWPIQLSAWSVLLVVLVAVLLGLVAGAYPAFKAARIQPIEALMYE